MRTLRLDKKELSNLLNVSCSKIESLERNGELKCELSIAGFKYYGKEIIRRKSIYKVNLIDKKKKELYSMCKGEFKTNKCNEFKTYFIKRTSSDNQCTRKDLAEESNVSLYTIDKWDSIMLDKGIISEKGWAYFKITNDIDGSRYVEQCPREEYNLFWNVKMSMRYYEGLREKHEAGEITTKELQVRTAELSRLEDGYEGFFYYKIKLFNTNTDNPIYLDIKTLIFSRNS